MADVFILGAGFSRAIGTSMPLVSDLRDDVLLKLVESLPSYADYLVDERRPNPDVEMWLGSLAEPQPFRTEAENLRAQGLFAELIGLFAADMRSRTHDTFLRSATARALSPPWTRRRRRGCHRAQSVRQSSTSAKQ